MTSSATRLGSVIACTLHRPARTGRSATVLALPPRIGYSPRGGSRDIGSRAGHDLRTAPPASAVDGRPGGPSAALAVPGVDGHPGGPSAAAVVPGVDGRPGGPSGPRSAGRDEYAEPAFHATLRHDPRTVIRKGARAN